MKKVAINQLSMFGEIFGEDKKEETKDETKAVTFGSHTAPVDNGCEVEGGSDEEETETGETQTGSDSDLPDFAAIEQSADGGKTGTVAGKPDAKKAAAPAAKKFEEIERLDGWLVCYAGHKIPVTEKLTLNDIRKRLEKEFPELTKDRTEMMFDEKKGIIIPVVKGAKKGAR